jgi:hypothetical protein
MITTADIRRIFALYLLSGLAGGLLVFLAAISWKFPYQILTFVVIFSLCIWLLVQLRPTALIRLSTVWLAFHAARKRR